MILKEIKKIESSPPAKTLLTLFFLFFYMKTYMLHYLYTTQVVQEMSCKYLIFKLHIF